MPRLTGKCFCEKITYELLNGIFAGPVYNCHCSRCRRWGGDAFRTSVLVSAADFRWITGEELLIEYQANPDAVKTFCSICGGHLISKYPKKPEVVRISLGGIDQDPGIRPQAHIYVGSKAPWFDIPADGLPRYQEGPPA